MKVIRPYKAVTSQSHTFLTVVFDFFRVSSITFDKSSSSEFHSGYCSTFLSQSK